MELTLTADPLWIVLILIGVWLLVYTAVRVALGSHEPRPMFGAIAEPTAGGLSITLHLLSPTALHDVAVRWQADRPTSLASVDTFLPVRPIVFDAFHDADPARHARWLEVTWIPDGGSRTDTRHASVPVVVPARGGPSPFGAGNHSRP